MSSDDESMSIEQLREEIMFREEDTRQLRQRISRLKDEIGQLKDILVYHHDGYDPANNTCIICSEIFCPNCSGDQNMGCLLDHTFMCATCGLRTLIGGN